MPTKCQSKARVVDVATHCKDCASLLPIEQSDSIRTVARRMLDSLWEVKKTFSFTGMTSGKTRCRPNITSQVKSHAHGVHQLRIAPHDRVRCHSTFESTVTSGGKLGTPLPCKTEKLWGIPCCSIAGPSPPRSRPRVYTFDRPKRNKTNTTCVLRIP